MRKARSLSGREDRDDDNKERQFKKLLENVLHCLHK